MTDIHIPARLDCTPHAPPLPMTTEYVALCGYISQNKNEFRKDRQSLDVVTCEACLAKLGRVVEPMIQWRLK